MTIKTSICAGTIRLSVFASFLTLDSYLDHWKPSLKAVPAKLVQYVNKPLASEKQLFSYNYVPSQQLNPPLLVYQTVSNCRAQGRAPETHRSSSQILL